MRVEPNAAIGPADKALTAFPIESVNKTENTCIEQKYSIPTSSVVAVDVNTTVG